MTILIYLVQSFLGRGPAVQPRSGGFEISSRGHAWLRDYPIENERSRRPRAPELLLKAARASSMIRAVPMVCTLADSRHQASFVRYRKGCGGRVDATKALRRGARSLVVGVVTASAAFQRERISMLERELCKALNRRRGPPVPEASFQASIPRASLKHCRTIGRSCLLAACRTTGSPRLLTALKIEI